MFYDNLNDLTKVSKIPAASLDDQPFDVIHGSMFYYNIVYFAFLYFFEFSMSKIVSGVVLSDL